MYHVVYVKFHAMIVAGLRLVTYGRASGSPEAESRPPPPALSSQASCFKRLAFSLNMEEARARPQRVHFVT